jgi:hypothetical protein
MKKLLGIVVLGLLSSSLIGCDDRRTSERKDLCQLYVDKKSEDFKECIKSDDHVFVYSLEKNIEKERKKIKEYNKDVEIINSIRLNINHSEYKEVEFRNFLDENFNDTLLLRGLKNDQILGKKIKFNSGFYIQLGDEPTLVLRKQDPNDYFNSIWRVSADFHNIEVQSKILEPYKKLIFYKRIIGDVDNEVYGIFYKKPGVSVKQTEFYIQDIKMKKKKFNKNQIINYLIDRHGSMMRFGDDSDKRHLTEVRSNVKNLIKTILDK